MVWWSPKVNWAEPNLCLCKCQHAVRHMNETTSAQHIITVRTAVFSKSHWEASSFRHYQTHPSNTASTPRRQGLWKQREAACLRDVRRGLAVFFYSILGALSCVLQLCVSLKDAYILTLVSCCDASATSQPLAPPAVHSFQLGLQLQQHQFWLFDLNMTEAVTYMHTGHQCWLQLCHQLTLEVFLQELPRLAAHPTLPHFLHLPETQYFRWSVSAERRPRWWMRCGLTHACDAVRTEPSVLPSAAVFRCLLVCFSVQQSSTLHLGSWHGRAAAGEKCVFVCARGGTAPNSKWHASWLLVVLTNIPPMV